MMQEDKTKGRETELSRMRNEYSEEQEMIQGRRKMVGEKGKKENREGGREEKYKQEK